jgi:hypothetical protein
MASLRSLLAGSDPTPRNIVIGTVLVGFFEAVAVDLPTREIITATATQNRILAIFLFVSIGGCCKIV